MYGWERLVLLRHLLEEGLPKTEIAERLGVSRRLVYHWIATGQLDQDIAALCVPRLRRPVPTKLGPYQDIITARLETYPDLSAVRLFEEVRAAGYPGGLAQVQVFVRQVRPRPPAEDVVRFETPPGHQAQVDFATFRFPWGRRYVFLLVLGYSRLLWLQFYARQTMATVIEALEAAFTYLGGVPCEVLFDQMRSVIVDDQRADGGRLLENPEFLRFATHWAFASVPVGRTGRRPRARLSGRCATCATTSSTAASSWATATSMRRRSSGWRARRIRACMGPRMRPRASASSGTSAPCCSPCRPAGTRR